MESVELLQPWFKQWHWQSIIKFSKWTSASHVKYSISWHLLLLLIHQTSYMHSREKPCQKNTRCANQRFVPAHISDRDPRFCGHEDKKSGFNFLSILKYRWPNIIPSHSSSDILSFFLVLLCFDWHIVIPIQALKQNATKNNSNKKLSHTSFPSFQRIKHYATQNAWNDTSWTRNGRKITHWPSEHG